MENQEKIKSRDGKLKFTVYLDPDVEKMFNELYAFRVVSGAGGTKSSIICAALRLYYEKEMRSFK